jgi:hypothetical protein
MPASKPLFSETSLESLGNPVKNGISGAVISSWIVELLGDEHAMWINKLSNCVGINHRVASVVVQRRLTNANLDESLEEYPSDERLNMMSPRGKFPYLAVSHARNSRRVTIVSKPQSMVGSCSCKRFQLVMLASSSAIATVLYTN